MDTTIIRNGSENELVPRNNVNLFDQIKLCIISDYFPHLLSVEPEGTMEFFIRDGELAIHFLDIEMVLGAPIQPLKKVGMKRSHLKTFLMLIEEHLTSFSAIDYGNIIIDYKMDDEGNFNLKMKYRKQVNHRRL